MNKDKAILLGIGCLIVGAAIGIKIEAETTTRSVEANLSECEDKYIESMSSFKENTEKLATTLGQTIDTMNLFCDRAEPNLKDIDPWYHRVTGKPVPLLSTISSFCEMTRELQYFKKNSIAWPSPDMKGSND